MFVFLGVGIIYFSSQRRDIISTFFSLISIPSGDANTISDSVRKELELFKLPLKNLTGIGTDNANVMVGKKGGVFAELKKFVTSLILVKCVCHSVQLAVNAACRKVLPPTLEYIVSETYSWFCKSSSRQIAYKSLYQSLNSEEVSYMFLICRYSICVLCM